MASEKDELVRNGAPLGSHDDDHDDHDDDDDNNDS